MATLNGTGASAGIGIGSVMLVTEPSLEYIPKTVTDFEAEKQRLTEAIDAFAADMQKKADNIRANAGEEEAAILEGHIAMALDPGMSGEMKNLIDAGTCAEAALEQICDMFAGMFAAADDELMQQRATDVVDIKNGILAQLLGVREVDISLAPINSIIVVHDLTPSMTAGINPENVVGIVTEVGGMTSHSAILARALEIPAVLSVPDVTKSLEENEQVIIDGQAGELIIKPSSETVEKYEQKRTDFLEKRAQLQKFIGLKSMTADGTEVELFGNIGKPDDAKDVVDRDGEGVGLFRTEFLFMDNTQMPSEEEQFSAYQQAALIMKGKPVIIRTLDIGGDKEIPYMEIEHEDNPFMGFRAIRYCLARLDIYRVQLRALLRASAFGDIRIMVPLVTSVEELTEVRSLVAQIMDEFDREGIEYNKDIQIGCMIETPAASLIADLLAEDADFFSIGTNDLTGYTMAVDRGNDKVRYLYSTYHPAVLRSICNIIKSGHEKGISVGMCGEAAADPILIPLWISFGLDEYSVSATSILSTRKFLADWTKKDADALTNKVLACKTAAESYALLKDNAEQ